MNSIFILNFFRTLFPKKNQIKGIFWSFLLLLSSGIFSAQIVVVGNATVISSEDAQISPSEDQGNNAATMYIGKGATITNLQNITGVNPDLKVVKEEREVAKTEVKESRESAKSLEPKISKKRKEFEQKNSSASKILFNQDSGKNLSLLNLKANQHSISVNFNYSGKVGIIAHKLSAIALFDTQVERAINQVNIIQHFQYYVRHVTRPPPSFS